MSSSNVVVGVLEVLLLGSLLVLNDGANDEENEGSNHVVVESACNSSSILNSLIDGERILVATSHDSNTCYEYISSSHCWGKDDDVVEEDHSQDSHHDSHTNTEDPEKNVWGGGHVEEGAPDEQSQAVASPAGQNEGSELGDLHEDEADKETKQEGAANHGPAHPGLSLIVQESSVENDENDEDGEQNSGQKEDGLPELSSEEANDESNDNGNREHSPLVVEDPSPEGVSGASSGGVESNVWILRVRIINSVGWEYIVRITEDFDSQVVGGVSAFVVLGVLVGDFDVLGLVAGLIHIVDLRIF